MDAHARVPQEAFAQAVTPAVAAMANGGIVHVLQDAVVLTCTLMPLPGNSPLQDHEPR
jgi:hypothetical protein